MSVLCVFPSCWSIPHFTGQARLSGKTVFFCKCFHLKLERTLLENERVSVFLANLQESKRLGRALSNLGSNPGGGGGGDGGYSDFFLHT